MGLRYERALRSQDRVHFLLLAVLKSRVPTDRAALLLPSAQLFFRSELFFSLSLWIFGKHAVLQQNKPMKVKTSSLPVCKHFLEQYAQL